MKTFEELSKNFPTEPWRGYYLNRAGRQELMDDVPLVSHVVDNLYVGGCIHGIDVEDHFSHIFSMYPWERYAFDTRKTELHEFKMYDSHDGLDIETVERASDSVVEALSDDGNVLVHCQAGINRSNLVAARALMKAYDLSSTDAIRLLEEKRHRLILSNQSFKDYVLSTDFPSL